MCARVGPNVLHEFGRAQLGQRRSNNNDVRRIFERQPQRCHPIGRLRNLHNSDLVKCCRHMQTRPGVVIDNEDVQVIEPIHCHS
jgi:hypothetical protein